MRATSIAMAGAILAFSAPTVSAQLPAFPGAEGAGAYAKGGRDGDVYIVTNLNDSGQGSLRYGIENAPAAGRMIVFGVSGTINLNSDIVIDDDTPFITIAGQSAPAGGITLAHRALRITDTHDVIVQHIASRPGDFAAVTDVYEPDAVWIRNSDNVIVDHVSASWSIDEVFSTSHTSDQVTVQWSYITEALHNSVHGSGNGTCCENHGYGGIIDGQQISYHHNLFAHNRSRNPRPGGQATDADFVNNVIYNAGDQYGYSGSSDNLDLNYIANFGIDGPNTTRDQLYNGDSPTTRIYASGNYFDHHNSNNDPNGLLDLTPAGSNTLGGVLGTDYVLNPAPVNVGGITVNATDAPTAYLQVLSYAGANRGSRDPIDNRVLRTVVNQWGDHIDSQNEVGGWHYPVSQTVALDPDGLPDWWKVKNGFDPDDNTVGLQKPVPGGYTNLELYLHELNARYLPPAATVQKVVTTAYGAGADAQVNENGGLSATSTGIGTAATLDAHWTGSSGATNQAILMKFDLSQIVPGTIKSASLQLSTAAAISGTHNFTVYGLEHDADGWDWNESTVEFASAPGLVFDGNSRTLGVNDLFDDANQFTYGDPADLLRLGAINTTSGTLPAGSTISLNNLNLAVFLNMAAYFQDESQEGIVTLLLQQNNNAPAASFYSKEGSAEFAPRLVLEAVLAAVEPVLPGDFNNDGTVDAGDYVRWRNHLGDPDETNIAFNGDGGNVGLDDYALWKAHYGNPPGGPGLNGSHSPVPEPISWPSALAAALTLVTLRRARCRLAPVPT